MNLPIKPVVLCKHLINAVPGKLKPEKLRKVRYGGRLHHCAAIAWEAMVSAAELENIKLRPTSIGDMYRTYASQEAGFRARYQEIPIPGASTRTFENKTWYLKKGMAPMAVPGTSKHNLGIAVDVKNASGDILKWLVKHAPLFGWSWEVVPGEPWHIRYVAGDHFPAEVVAYMDSLIE